MNRRAVQTLTLPHGGSQLADLRRGSIFFAGTATAIIRYAGFSIAADPSADSPAADLAILSHLRDDPDHLVGEPQMPIVTTRHAAEALNDAGCERAFSLQTWEPFEVFKGESHLRITAMPAKRAGFLSFLAPPLMGAMLEFFSGDKIPLRVYLTGDTSAHSDLEQIPRRYLNIDVALGTPHISGAIAPRMAIPIPYASHGETLDIEVPDVRL